MKQRIITGVVLFLIIVPCVIVGGLPWMAFMALISVFAAYELLHITNHPEASKYMYPLMGAFILGSVFYGGKLMIESSLVVLYLAVLLTCGIFDERMPMLRMGYYFLSAVLTAMGLHMIYYMRAELGLSYVLMLAGATLGADTGAYFFGRAFGKHKLNERLSPKKTIEGSLGGTLVGSILGIILGIALGVDVPVWFLVILCLVLSTTGQIGDLSYSSIKRTFEVKDYSRLLPGHGGVLDRFDSIIFNAMVLGLMLSAYQALMLAYVGVIIL